MKTSRTTKIILTMLIISLILPGIASSQKTAGNDGVNLPNPEQEFNLIEQIPKFIVTQQENRPTPAPGEETEQLKTPVALSGAPFELPIEPTPTDAIELVAQEPAPTEPPALMEQNPAAEDPAAEQQPLTTQEPLSSDEPIVIEETIFLEEDEQSEEPLPSGEPAVTDEPIITPEPEKTEEPLPTGEPAVTDEPFTTPEPEQTEEPLPTGEPAVTDEPLTTPEPEQTEDPLSTEEPVIIEEPFITPVPEQTEEPLPTEEPVITDEPFITPEPDQTEEPHPTDEPVIIEEPFITPEPPIAPEIIPADEETAEIGVPLFEILDEQFPDRRIVIYAYWGENDYIKVNDTVRLTAQLSGYESLDYAIRWQFSANGQGGWQDIGEAESTYTFKVNEENYYWFWRVAVDITGVSE